LQSTPLGGRPIRGGEGFLRSPAGKASGRFYKKGGGSEGKKNIRTLSKKLIRGRKWGYGVESEQLIFLEKGGRGISLILLKKDRPTNPKWPGKYAQGNGVKGTSKRLLRIKVFT